jgi:hypothetical protein
MIRELFHGRSDLVTEPIVQHNDGSDQVGTIISALHIASVAVDAELGVDGAATRCRRIVDDLAHGGPGLTGGKSSCQQYGHCNNQDEKSEP